MRWTRLSGPNHCLHLDFQTIGFTVLYLARYTCSCHTSCAVAQEQYLRILHNGVCWSRFGLCFLRKPDLAVYCIRCFKQFRGHTRANTGSLLVLVKYSQTFCSLEDGGKYRFLSKYACPGTASRRFSFIERVCDCWKDLRSSHSHVAQLVVLWCFETVKIERERGRLCVFFALDDRIGMELAFFYSFRAFCSKRAECPCLRIAHDICHVAATQGVNLDWYGLWIA